MVLVLRYILDRSVLWKITDDYKIDILPIYIDTLGPKIVSFTTLPYFFDISTVTYVRYTGTAWDSGFSQNDDTHPDFI